MTPRARRWIVAGVAVTAVVATTIVGVVAYQSYLTRSQATSPVATTSPDDWATGDRIVFRNTALGQGYGYVASVPLDDPTGPRAVTQVPCDRVAATTDEFSCLRTDRGIATTFSGMLYRNDGTLVEQWPLAGVPSRTRISPDGTMISSTAFVTGHSYATIGFSTETVVHGRDGSTSGNFEDFTLLVDGQTVAPVDRNYWGVTFIDDTQFYATAGLTVEGKTYLVKGDLTTKTLTAVAENVECPSLSPDGTRIAFKRVTSGAGPTVHWTPAILDLATGEVQLLPETRSVDDQIQWLDDETVLYGMPRDDSPGDTDVWRTAADGSGSPEVFIEHAWSPTVVQR